MKGILTIATLATFFYADGLARLYFEGNCITYHFENKDISAPSIQKVVTAYKQKYKDKKTFTKNMTEWILDPKQDTALMQEAILKYELVPKMAYDGYTLKQIANFLYENY